MLFLRNKAAKSWLVVGLFGSISPSFSPPIEKCGGDVEVGTPFSEF